MKQITGLVLASCAVCGPANAEVLWVDNFNTADTANFDGAPLDGRLSGTASGETYLRSFGFQQNISNNQLLLPSGTNGVRFESAANDPAIVGQTDRYNWAAGSVGASILSAGGFNVAFDWIAPENTLQDWVSFQVGTINDDNGNLTDDDYGILFRNVGGTQRFANGSDLGAGGEFGASAGGVTRQVAIAYSFSSFADGTTVNAVSSVDGTQVASDSFVWDGNGGELRFELGHNAADTRIDNLTISTIPEPAGLALCALGFAGIALRRRR